MSRTQLPLTPAFGVTIHKSQGLTLEKVVVELGPKDFANGLAFVTISRVNTLAGLAFRSPFSIERLKRTDTPALIRLRVDTEHMNSLGFTLDTYNVDMSMYTFTNDPSP